VRSGGRRGDKGDTGAQDVQVICAALPRNHRPQVQGGLLTQDCADMLRAFFAFVADTPRPPTPRAVL
jgi:hypothetical protein